uniref:Uncharacterized protein n=1 Tax=Solanum lycopersicum TaxID=4081 RepID=A0A3Q7EV75_SOLLC
MVRDVLAIQASSVEYDAFSAASVGTSNVATAISVATTGNVVTKDFTYVYAAIGSHSSVNAGPSAVQRAGLRAGCTPCEGPRVGISVGCNPSATPIASCTPCLAKKQNTSTTLRGGASLTYKKLRPKKVKTVGSGLLFGSGGSLTERSGNTDRVLHISTLISSTPTNIDLSYKPMDKGEREELQLIKDNYERRVRKALKAHQTFKAHQTVKAHIRFHFV